MLGEDRRDRRHLHGVSNHLGDVEGCLHGGYEHQRALKVGCESRVHSATEERRNDQVKGLFLHHANDLRMGHCLVAVVEESSDHSVDGLYVVEGVLLGHVILEEIYKGKEFRSVKSLNLIISPLNSVGISRKTSR